MQNMTIAFLKKRKLEEERMSEWISSPQSSNVAGFGYDEANQMLTVEFNNGSRYNYYDVPQHIFDGMNSADSKGGFLHANIKGVYRYARQ